MSQANPNGASSGAAMVTDEIDVANRMNNIVIRFMLFSFAMYYISKNTLLSSGMSPRVSNLRAMVEANSNLPSNSWMSDVEKTGCRD
jgi:hypothetical protein